MTIPFSAVNGLQTHCILATLESCATIKMHELIGEKNNADSLSPEESGCIYKVFHLCYVCVLKCTSKYFTN